MANTLFGISFSPWSIKARWALDHHQVPYRYVEHVPMIGSLRLRLVLRRLRGPVSVPVLRAGSEVFGESLDIARWADRQGSGDGLLPEDRHDEIAEWNRRSDALLGPGRILTLRAGMQRPEVLRDDLPGPLGKIPGVDSVTRTVLGYLLRKYHVAGTDDELKQAMRDQLVHLRDALGDGDYLLEDFSYADIAMVVALQGVKPPGRDRVPLEDANRETWTRPDLAEEFSSLLAWRDRIYERHHVRAARRAR